MIQTRAESPEVLYCLQDGVTLDRREIAALKRRFRRAGRRRMRLCLHRGPRDRLHRMTILMPRGAYVRPHRHRRAAETYQFIDGEGDVFLFDEAGRIVRSFPVGPYRSGGVFLYEQRPGRFHGLLVRSAYLIYQETKEGPWRRSDTEFPAWAPAPEDARGCREFARRLAAAAAGRRARGRQR